MLLDQETLNKKRSSEDASQSSKEDTRESKKKEALQEIEKREAEAGGQPRLSQ
jgi:hypothetical protein